MWSNTYILTSCILTAKLNQKDVIALCITNIFLRLLPRLKLSSVLQLLTMFFSNPHEHNKPHNSQELSDFDSALSSK